METSPETQSHDTTAYIITPISKRARCIKAAIPILVAIVISTMTWWVQYQNNALARLWLYMIPILALGLWLGLVLYKETEKKHVAFIYVYIPLKNRIKVASAITGGTLLICGLIWLIQYSNDQLRDYWWYAWLIALMGFGLFTSELLKSRIKVLTSAGEIEAKRLETQRQLKEDASRRRYAEIENSWYVRYPVASLFVYGAWITEEKENQWWLSIGFLLMAAFFAREISLLVLVGVILYMLFQGIAALPVSVAVIIGAIIISNAIRN